MDPSKPISIPDLAYDGFMNMIKYAYGYEVNELDLTKISEIIIAADKYLIERLIDDLNEYIEKHLNGANCLVLFDKLIQSKNKPPDMIKTCVQKRSDSAFRSEWFTEIHQNTLVELLKLDCLNVKEIDVLNGIANWIEAQIKNNYSIATWDEANRQKLFQPFKSMVRFGDFTAKMLVQHDKLFESLLTTDELYKLLKHLVNESEKTQQDQLEDYSSARRKYCSDRCSSQSTDCLSRKVNTDVTRVTADMRFDTFCIKLTVDETVFIKSIETLLASDLHNLKFEVYEFNKTLKKIPDLVIKKHLNKDQTLEFIFKNCLQINSNCEYLLEFKFGKVYFGHRDTLFDTYSKYGKNNLFFEDRRHPVTFKLDPCDRFHCINGIKFHF